MAFLRYSCNCYQSKMKWLIIVLFLNFLCYAASYKILVMYPMPIVSINILGKGVVQSLLKDGHEVTYITTHPLNITESKQFRQIDISQNKALLENDTTWSIRNILEKELETDFKDIQHICQITAKQTFLNENMTKFLENPNEHFDAVIVDLIEAEMYAGLSALYNCPMLWVFSMGAHWQVLRLIGDYSSPAYDADYYALHVPPFTFTQRVQQLVSRVKWSIHKRFHILPQEIQLYENTFGPLLAKRGRKLPDYEEVLYNASMIFGNEHNAVLFRPSTPQNFKYIGGIHIDDPVKPLPKNLQDLMDKAPHGVIYFSMGSFLQSKELPMKFIRELLDVFGELKQTVIWKYEDNNLKDVPKNVYIIQWAPQQSILAHPNLKFFISHGGLHSSIETIHFGVPIIGVPGMLDQKTNIIKAVSSGYAIKVDLNHNTPKNLKIAINTMLSDDSYQKRAQELSLIYHDRPMKPGAELAYWVRHVVKTRGARHLRSPAIDVPFYQRLYLDLVALILAIIFILSLFLCKLLRKSNKNLQKKKKQ